MVVEITQSVRDIGEPMWEGLAAEKQENRAMLRIILQNTKYLARQGLPLRGHGDDTESNFQQLLKLRVEDVTTLADWRERKTNKYTSPEIQNEMIQIMALNILRKISANIRNSSYFIIMADEAIDASNKEQFVICLRSVDDDFEVHEEFIGLYEIDNLTANTLVAAIKDTLLRMNLNLSRCRGQCYDGAGNMSGAKHGTSTQILKEEERALYTHCYGHALNLAVGDSIRKSSIMSDALGNCQEISDLLKYSPKRDALFRKIEAEIAPESIGFYILCPTRWTVRGNCLQSIYENYEVLRTLWDECLQTVKQH